MVYWLYTQGCALPLLNLSRFYLKGIVASERNPNTGNAYLEYHILESFWCVKPFCLNCMTLGLLTVCTNLSGCIDLTINLHVCNVA